MERSAPDELPDPLRIGADPRLAPGDLLLLGLRALEGYLRVADGLGRIRNQAPVYRARCHPVTRISGDPHSLNTYGLGDQRVGDLSITDITSITASS